MSDNHVTASDTYPDLGTRNPNPPLQQQGDREVFRFRPHQSSSPLTSLEPVSRSVDLEVADLVIWNSALDFLLSCNPFNFWILLYLDGYQGLLFDALFSFVKLLDWFFCSLIGFNLVCFSFAFSCSSLAVNLSCCLCGFFGFFRRELSTTLCYS